MAILARDLAIVEGWIGIIFESLRLFGRGELPEYQWMNIPEVFLCLDSSVCNCLYNSYL